VACGTSTLTATNGWYRLAQGSDLEQGDLLDRIPVYLPLEYLESPAPQESAPFQVSYFDVVVLTASCDLAQAKTDSVLLCPHWDFAELNAINPNSALAKPGVPGEIEKGRRPRYCFLAPSAIPEQPMNLRIIDFARALSLPLAYVARHVASNRSRLRMNSPYREHVAQSFGTFYTRIGLPLHATDC
jgi:hypothetical protein